MKPHVRPRPQVRTHLRQHGFSLVELIVAMVIGLTVVGAALAMYVSSGFSGRGSNATSQMTEDANIALSLLRSQIAMAGYSAPTSADASGQLVKAYSGRAIFGCKGGTSDNASALDTMVCANDGSPDSIVVLYQADVRNTVPTTDATPLPTDCLGTGLDEVSPAGGTPHFVAENRYYVNGTNLSCRGNGGGNPQPLVENVTDLKFSYGVAGTTKGLATRYLTAQEVSGNQGASSPLWSQVTSVRICLEIRSETQVLDEDTGYTKCDGSAGTADKFLHRAFTTTVVLQNRIRVPT